jgi:hypothetical protein
MMEGVTRNADGTVTSNRKLNCDCGRRADFLAIYGEGEEAEWDPVCWQHTDRGGPDELLSIIKMNMGEERRVREVLGDEVEVYTSYEEGPTGLAAFRSVRRAE